VTEAPATPRRRGRPPKPKQPCTNDWCNRPQHAKGYCQACYTRGWKAGDMDRAQTVHREWEISRVDIDEVAVVRLRRGDVPEHTTLGDREQAVRELHALGLNDREIADRLRRPVLFVWRTRQRLGLAAVQRGPRRRGEIYLSDEVAWNKYRKQRRAATEAGR